MFDLIRFFEKKEYVEDFLNGMLYMNSIGHFRNFRNPAVQNDISEGLGDMISPENYDSEYNTNLTSVIGKEHICFSIMNQIESMKYCHVCCLSLHEYDDNKRIVMKVPDEMRKMGKYAVIVRNVQRFVDLIFDKPTKEKLYGLMGPVCYHSPKEEIKYMDLFDKLDKFQYEHEWRFAYIPDYERAKKLAAENVNRLFDEHCYFSIGNIKDIAEEVSIETLFKDIGALYEKRGVRYMGVDNMPESWSIRRKEIEKMLGKGLPISYDMYPDQYVGWAPREAFRNVIMNIDNGAFKPMFTIG